MPVRRAGSPRSREKEHEHGLWTQRVFTIPGTSAISAEHAVSVMDSVLDKKSLPPVFKTGRADLWPRERVRLLGRAELEQLQANALTLAEPELAARCAEVLADLPARGPSSSRAPSTVKSQMRLISRSRAFEARGIWTQAARASWSGVRNVDGMVVFALWAESIESREGGCCCLLWAPNAEGSRPWSDTLAGRDRLEHCKAAMARGDAEGFLVQGERLTGRLPEDRAKTVLGVDAEIVIHFRVERRGSEYWGVWGGRVSPPRRHSRTQDNR